MYLGYNYLIFSFIVFKCQPNAAEICFEFDPFPGPDAPDLAASGATRAFANGLGGAR